MRINSLKCKMISLMNGSGAGHSKKNMLLADLYKFDKFRKNSSRNVLLAIDSVFSLARFYRAQRPPLSE